MSATPPVVLITAPSNLGLMPPPHRLTPGTSFAPTALLKSGLAHGLKASRIIDVPAPDYVPDRSEETGVRNGEAIRQYSYQLADIVSEVLDDRALPLVIGGDCSIVLGDLLALQSRGRYGLLYIDGHTDFQMPATSATGGVAGMCLAMAAGRGPELLTHFDSDHPLMLEERIVVMGTRDQDGGPLIGSTHIPLYDVPKIREMGIDAAVDQATAGFQQHRLKGCWVHIDLDVLDGSLMPAVDSPTTGGLTYDELAGIIHHLLKSGMVTGMEVTIYDPTLDPDGGYARQLVEMLVKGFGG